MKKAKGKVFLVGAGPGDIGLLTLKAHRCIQKADTILYDFHVNSRLLNLAKEGAELIYAGKRGGRHEMTQDEINKSLLKKAVEGKIVCRLKGGDPFVFGRGGEEAEILAAHGVDFEIIPGVTSAISVPAYAGIPLTHRKHSSSFAVVTGNEDETKKDSKLNWPAIAQGFDTLVFLMGVKNIDYITSKLIKNGRDPLTPAAIIRWGTRPEQVTLTTTLKDISETAKGQKIRPPAVMVVGSTVGLRDTLNWYEKKPLFGQRILITRQYTVGYEPLEEMGAEIFEFPTIKTVPPDSYDALDAAIDTIETYDWIIITSSNGFKYFFNRLIDKNKDIRDLKGIRLCAIGEKTAETLKGYGLLPAAVPEEFNAEGLVKLFTKDGADVVKGKRFLLPRAEKSRETFPDAVRDLGGHIDTPAAYKTIKPQTHAKRLERFLREGKITMATFTSASSFNNLQEFIGSDTTELLREVTIAAIGPVTKKAIEKAGLTVGIMAEKATIEGLVQAIIVEAAALSSNVKYKSFR
ncbi:uroporphyrinogen-III C-methyltransferase [Candidatus Magnetominusculus xianensis]|uniref:uroporphyrinogen-III C-methyltransferase n=1 Tax=Candidatus Magnetominusculus xianensis TaxID=1748249 RepID=A0ABR5SET4_9BACT|nr:uroporphyrinogen-III C-methyltransferase [Candidatus Magnetominusculus xianensis]KWT83466.1 uroporphyrinogen-III C-methyltransferase [Candidatus Magnetominusculus xianensis]MBF0404106.1 uroporphyrinogen-III C-methyltransferase [Nitrospirota bacterium]